MAIHSQGGRDQRADQAEIRHGAVIPGPTNRLVYQGCATEIQSPESRIRPDPIERYRYPVGEMVGRPFTVRLAALFIDEPDIGPFPVPDAYAY